MGIGVVARSSQVVVGVQLIELAVVAVELVGVVEGEDGGGVPGFLGGYWRLGVDLGLLLGGVEDIDILDDATNVAHLETMVLLHANHLLLEARLTHNPTRSQDLLVHLARTRVDESLRRSLELLPH
jgi:hypothetical protein